VEVEKNSVTVVASKRAGMQLPARLQRKIEAEEASKRAAEAHRHRRRHHSHV
jgi:uncharacterized protein YdeI (YjbR/CyaY-like superfamily)